MPIIQKLMMIKKNLKAHYSIEDWEKTWMRKLEGNALFISALNKENLNDFRKMVYREVRKNTYSTFPI